MEILQIVIISIFFVCCALLILFIMLQSGKGGGMGIFGGGGSNTAFGSSTVDVITKATWYGAAGFFVLAILAAISFADSGPKIPVVPTGNTPGASGKPIPGTAPANKGKTGEKKDGETKSENTGKKPE